MDTEMKSGITKIRDEEEEKIREAFALIDTDGYGYIDELKLAVASKSVGIYLDNEQISELIQKLDDENTRKISFDQFRGMMINRAIVII